MGFKISVIGCGEISNGYHGPAYQRYAKEDSSVELAACCDRNVEKAVAFAERFGFRHYYTDFVKMLEQESPDAVCLNVQPRYICEASCAILRLGFPLLLEKPAGMTKVECEQMIAAAAHSGAPNQVALNRRHIPLVQRAKRALEQSCRPDEIQCCVYTLTRVGRTESDFSTTAVHGIDTARFLMGREYAHIRFHYQDLAALGPGVANTYLDCTFQGGTTALIAFCPVAGTVTERAVIHAAGHTFDLQLPLWNVRNANGRLLHYRAGELLQDVSAPDVSEESEGYVINGFYSEDKSFFDDIRSGRRPTEDIESQCQITAIAEAMRLRNADYVCC
jgi:predicted dehydrogenase